MPVLAPLAATTTTANAVPVAALMQQGHIGSPPVLLPLVTRAPGGSRPCRSSVQQQLTPAAVHALPLLQGNTRCLLQRPRARHSQAPSHTYRTQTLITGATTSWVSPGCSRAIAPITERPSSCLAAAPCVAPTPPSTPALRNSAGLISSQPPVGNRCRAEPYPGPRSPSASARRAATAARAPARLKARSARPTAARAAGAPARAPPSAQSCNGSSLLICNAAQQPLASRHGINALATSARLAA